MNVKSNLMNRGFPLLGLILLITAIILIVQDRPSTGSVTAIQTPPVAPPDKEGAVAGAGVIQPSSELVAVGAPVPGLVKSIEVMVGNEVKRGQVLLTIDDREAQAEVAASEANLALAKQNLVLAEVELADKVSNQASYESIGDRRAMVAEELTRRNFAVKSSVAKLAVSRATVAHFRTQLQQARTVSDLRIVRAPLDGKILQIKVRPGEFVPAAQLVEPLITMGAVKPLHVKIDIDEADIERANFGGAATVSFRGIFHTTVQAKFIRVEPLVVPKRSLTNSASERVDTRVLQVIYELPPNAEGFYVGQQVDAFLPALPVRLRTKTGSRAEEKTARNQNFFVMVDRGAR